MLVLVMGTRAQHCRPSVLSKNLLFASVMSAAAFFAPAISEAATKCIPMVTPAPSASPESQLAEDATTYATEAKEPPLYSMGTEVYTIDRDVTAYYYFQSNTDGSAKIKHELRYDHNLWDTCAQLQIRFPVITKIPLSGNPYAGFGNLELAYSYSVPSPTFDHALEVRLALPTNANHVDNTDTELKFFYTPKWKIGNGLSIAYMNEYDQTIIQPPGSTYTSYYEGKLTLPNFTVVKGVKFAAFYNFRVLFDTGGLFKDAIGGQLFGNINDVALNFYDSWGVGTNRLWRFKAEGQVVVRI